LVSYPKEPEPLLVDVLDGAGVATYGVVQEAGSDPAPPAPGFAHDDRETVDILGVEFTVDYYTSTG
jgi:hypothetical protein